LREGGKTKCQYAARVARVAIDHRTGRTTLDRTHAHQLAPQRVARRSAGADVDLIDGKIVERLHHQAERPRGERIVRTGDGLLEDVGLEHRHRAPAHNHSAIERHDRRRKKLLLEAELVHHVADHGRKKLAPRALEKLLIGLGHGFRSQNSDFRA
jgi:hypothetical protein